MMVLLQHALEDGPINLHEVWRRPIRETLRLIEWLCEHTVVGFNLSFDWFHIAKIYTIFRLCDPDWVPVEHINEIALLEPQGQDGPCVKPACALDLMLHSRKGPYQSLMAREDIRIKRVPSSLAYALASELEGRVQLDNIYFAKSADPNAPKWQVFDRKDRFGDIDTDFKDVVLRFNPAGGLKFLAEHAMGYKPKFHFKDVEPPTAWRPYELGYAPTALAVSSLERNWEVWGKRKGKTVKVAVEEVLTDPALNLDDPTDGDEVRMSCWVMRGLASLPSISSTGRLGQMPASTPTMTSFIHGRSTGTSSSRRPVTTTRRWRAWCLSSGGMASRLTRKVCRACSPRPRKSLPSRQSTSTSPGKSAPT
jgi:hypothetical protein